MPPKSIEIQDGLGLAIGFTSAPWEIYLNPKCRMYPMTDPWDERNIYIHENHKKSTIHVGQYTSPMDPSWVFLSGKIKV